MKAKKKLKKIKEELDAWENRGVTPNQPRTERPGILVAIRDIVDGTHQEEPKPEFKPGDFVCVLFNEDQMECQEVQIFDDTNYEIQEMEDDGTSALIQVWVDVEHLSKV